MRAYDASLTRRKRYRARTCESARLSRLDRRRARRMRHAAPRHPPERRPPPHVLVVGLEQVALRTTAWVELHAWLAAEAREHAHAELDGRHAYRASPDDDRDELSVARPSPRGLRRREVRPSRRRRDALRGALPRRAARLPRAPLDRARIHRARRRGGCTRGARTRGRAAGDEARAGSRHRLAAPPPVVDLVSDAPVARQRRADPHAPRRARAVASRGRARESERMHDARIIDCVLAYAAIASITERARASPQPRAAARGRASDLERAWSALVVHASPRRSTGCEPRHSSALRSPRPPSCRRR